MEFDKSCSHHHKISHHRIFTDKTTKRLYHLSHMIGRIYAKMVISLLNFNCIPMPRILKGFNLCLALNAMFILKEHVIISAGIKRRVEIN